MYQLGMSVSSMLGRLFSRGVDSAPHSRENAWSPGCSVPCSNQIKIIANKTPTGLLKVGRYPLFRTSRGMCLLVVGEYKLYHSVWEPPIMYVAWKIPRSLGCYVDNEIIPIKILFISVSKTRALAPLQIPASLCEGPIYLVLLLSHHPLIKCTS